MLLKVLRKDFFFLHKARNDAKDSCVKVDLFNAITK